MIKLFTPLLFLRIAFPEKWRTLALAPLLLLVAFLLVLMATGSLELLYDSLRDDSVALDIMQPFIGIFAAFFLAALAAVATFNRPSLDERMEGETPTLHHAHFRVEPELLTRRRFLSFLFGYLSFLSIFFIVTSLFISPLLSAFSDVIILIYNRAFSVSQFLVIALVALFLHIVCVSLLGLHFLTERMSREPRPKL